jgi:broad specificity phosphatase PhoE
VLSSLQAQEPSSSPSYGVLDSAKRTKRIIFLVRHAEKELDTPGDNPPLVQAGRERAEDLKKTILKITEEEKAIPLQAIYVTQYLRTWQTAQPTADALGLVPIKMDAHDEESLVRELRKNPHSCLVVGHSNTIPSIARTLALGEDVPDIADYEYNRLFVITLEHQRRKTLSIQNYGMPSFPPADKKSATPTMTKPSLLSSPKSSTQKSSPEPQKEQ